MFAKMNWGEGLSVDTVDEELFLKCRRTCGLGSDKRIDGVGARVKLAIGDSVGLQLLLVSEKCNEIGIKGGEGSQRAIVFDDDGFFSSLKPLSHILRNTDCALSEGRARSKLDISSKVLSAFIARQTACWASESVNNSLSNISPTSASTDSLEFLFVSGSFLLVFFGVFSSLDDSGSSASLMKDVEMFRSFIFWPRRNEAFVNACDFPLLSKLIFSLKTPEKLDR